MNTIHFVDVIQSLKPHPPRRLYHYCRAQSLKYLVRQDSDIWCTHCNHLNDPEECWTGIRMFFDYLKKRAILLENVYELLRENAWQNSLWHKVFGKDGHSKLMPFTFSLSEEPDNPKMWKEYTNNCGYRLSFDADALEQNVCRVHETLSRLDPYNIMVLSLWPCFYEESDATAVEKIFDGLVADISEDLAVLSNNLDNPIAGRSILSKINSVAPLIKAEKWSYEKEWRLIMVRSNFERTHFVNHRARSYLSSSVGGVRGLLIKKEIEVCPYGNKDWESRYLEYECNDGYRDGEWDYLSEEEKK